MVSAQVHHAGRVPGETVAVSITCRLALGATGGTWLLTAAPVTVLPGLAVIANPRRHAR